MSGVEPADLHHRGCVTPQIIHNVMEQVGEDIDLDEDIDVLDGADELESWAQDKVKQALRQGHVDDEDWKGVSCLWHVTPHAFHSFTGDMHGIVTDDNGRIQNLIVLVKRASRNAHPRRKPKIQAMKK